MSREWFVSPSGDDRSDGTIEKPFATVSRAQEVLRAVPRTDPVRLFLRGGTYSLDRPLVFDHEDSGTAEAPISCVACAGERPVLSGGVRIAGWQRTIVNQKQAWVAEAPPWEFRQLWVNGSRRHRPRLPQEGFYRIEQVAEGVDWYGGTNEFFVRPGEVKAWSRLEDIEMVLLASWVESRLPLVSVDEARGRVVSRYRSALAPSVGSRYYVENVFAALSQPGTWYCDRQEGKLYYLPYPGEDPESCEVVAPRLATLLILQDVEHLRFEGLSFEHTEWRRSETTPIMRYEFRDNLVYMPSVVDDKANDHLAAVSVPGAIVGEEARCCRFEHCSVCHVGGYGIEWGRGCRDNEITECLFRDLGAGGVKLGTQEVMDAPISHGNRVIDCDIGPGGLVFHGAVGIWVGQSAHNLIAHNHVHDLFYTGISVGWSMGYTPSAAHDNWIEWNHIHDLGKGWLSDFGGIYLLGDAPGTLVRFNVVHDLASGEYGACGLYYDEGTSRVVGENNLLYNIAGDAFFMHYGRNNVLRNNILARCAKGALGSAVNVLDRSRTEPHVTLTVERNILYLTEGEAYRMRWDPNSFVVRSNLIWDANGRPLLCGGRTWEAWRRQGLDVDSRVADPGFVDPDRGDFRLSEGSPARDLGFVPFDLSQVGPRAGRQAAPSARWATHRPPKCR